MPTSEWQISELVNGHKQNEDNGLSSISGCMGSSNVSVTFLGSMGLQYVDQCN